MSRAKDTAGFGGSSSKEVRGTTPAAAAIAPDAAAGEKAAADQSVRINGFQQVIEMLRVADPAFRESLLKRLALKDRKLAASLRRDLLAENN